MQMHQLDSRIQRMLEELKGLTARKIVPVADIEIAPRATEAYVPFVNGSTWTNTDEWWDFRFTLTIPNDFCGVPTLHVQTGREGQWEAVNPQMVVRINGEIEQALDTCHSDVVLPKTSQPLKMVFNTYCPQTEKLKPLPFLYVTLQDVNADLQQLIYDLAVPHEAMLLLPEGDRERESTLEILARAIDLLDLRKPNSQAFDASIEAARAYLKAEYYEPYAKQPPTAIAECVGHTHIDVAWLWDLYQTRHKAVRSFATVLKLMALYPDYKFMSSQAALYNMVKEDEPALFERIRQAVQSGRWEVEGGMWVEADCNLASGESLVRQFLHGQEFFEREFGKQSRILWLPDVFGYSAALPQILKLCGIDYFMTTKLSWSEFNLSPYDTFQWKGIDGSEVLTHFSPSREYGDSAKDTLRHYTTYNTLLKPTQIAGGWQRFQQKGIDNHFLVSYGYGDGGGGPTAEMLENAKRMQMQMGVTPAVRNSHALPFFTELEKRVCNDPRLPKWSGELYLEYHRGTYTAMARNKRSNRKIELLLREVELWATYAARFGAQYPAQALHSIWQDVLTLQFHDILPGSSIEKVYQDSEAMYTQMFSQLETLKASAMQTLAKQLKGDVLAFNSLSFCRDDILWFDAPESVTALCDAQGSLYPVQRVEGRACAFVRGMASLSVTPYWFSTETVAAESLQVDCHAFQTPFFEGLFDSSMQITSLFDLASQREVARKGEALNQLVVYENKPHNYDAWDINIYYDRRHWPLDDVQSATVVSCGPVLARLRVIRRYMSSTVTQDITLYHSIGRIDFDTQVDWKEQQYLVKAHFPVDVFYNEATYDIQYGNIKRATHKNTSWDTARFEVCAHKWADVSEDDFGVSLLNDCKYGYSADEHSIALTLLKSSTYPNKHADQEEHRFTYSLYPHSGDWRGASTPEMAYRLNIPVQALPGLGVGKAVPFAQVDAPNVIIEAVKQALHGQGSILRMYECYNRRTAVHLTFGFLPNRVELCNLIEETIEELPLVNGELDLLLTPYQIVSLRIS